jgi:hypothetical protein
MNLNNSSIETTIDDTGLTGITLAGKQIIVKGGLSLYTGTGFSPTTNPFGYAGSTPPIGAITKSTIAGNPSQVNVIHQHPNVSVSYLYTLNGNNIQISIDVTNNGPSFQGLTFAGPTFTFDSTTPKGNLHTWAADYLNEVGVNFYHPSVETPLQLAYAYDSTHAIAFHSKTHSHVPTMFNATPGASGTNGTFPAYFFIDDVVQSNSTYHIALTIRAIAATDIPAIVAQYIADYAPILGPIQYVPDDRPVIQCAPLSGSPPTADNPFGFSPQRRLDLQANISTFLSYFPPISGLAQSVMFWEGQGWTDCEYNPNFDIFPPAVAANVPAIVSGLKALGISYGMLARPNAMVEQATFTTDEIVEIDAEDASQMSALLQRFNNVMAMGAMTFYFDSFGNDLNSYKILKQVRAAIGPDAPTWSEYITDISLPLTGLYAQITDNSGNTMWYTTETMQIFRLLVPKSSVVVFYNGVIDPTTSLPTLVTPDDYGRLRYTPLVADWLCGAWASMVKQLTQKYFTGKNWKG